MYLNFHTSEGGQVIYIRSGEAVHVALLNDSSVTALYELSGFRPVVREYKDKAEYFAAIRDSKWIMGEVPDNIAVAGIASVPIARLSTVKSLCRKLQAEVRRLRDPILIAFMCAGALYFLLR